MAEQKIFAVGDLGSIRIEVDLRWLDLPDEAAAQLRRIVHQDLPQVVAAARYAQSVGSSRSGPQQTDDQASDNDVHLDLPEQQPHTATKPGDRKPYAARTTL